jgi:hypothetical protein
MISHLLILLSIRLAIYKIIKQTKKNGGDAWKFLGNLLNVYEELQFEFSTKK